MADVLKGVAMTISGTLIGTEFNVKVLAIAVDNQMAMVDVSGVGDAGESTFVPGRTSRRFSFSGFVDDTSALNMQNVHNTTSATLSIAFDGGTGNQVIAGSVLVSDLDVTGGYTDGLYRVTGQGVFVGALTSATL